MRGAIDLTPKEYLMQYRQSMERTAEIEQHLNELKAEAYQLKDHEGHSVAMDTAVTRYVDACNAVASELNRLAAQRGEILGTIDSVRAANLRSVLYRKYILGESWEQVAVALNYSYRQTTRMHGAALIAVKDVLECPT